MHHHRLPDGPPVGPERRRRRGRPLQRPVLGQGALEWTKPKENGKFKAQKDGAWALSKELDIKPDQDDPGWQQVRFTLHVQGDPRKHRVQVDNLWIDPRASR